MSDLSVRVIKDGTDKVLSTVNVGRLQVDTDNCSVEKITSDVVKMFGTERYVECSRKCDGTVEFEEQVVYAITSNMYLCIGMTDKSTLNGMNVTRYISEMSDEKISILLKDKSLVLYVKKRSHKDADRLSKKIKKLSCESCSNVGSIAY